MTTKIVHIITSLEDGGAEAVLFRLVTASKQDMQHVVVCLRDLGKYGSLLLDQGILVHCIHLERGRVSWSGLRKLMALLRHEKPDLVQTWMYHANLLGGVVARLAGIRGVYWGIHHTRLVRGTTGQSTQIVDWICARLSSWVPRTIIACAHEARKIHVEKGYCADKFTVIPNGYDVSIFAPDEAAGSRLRVELGIAPDAHVVALVGRWNPLKDHANLIAALHILRQDHPNFVLILAGTGCDHTNTELVQLLQASHLDENTHLLGRRSDIPAIMNAADIHVLSSSSEAFPNVIAEAMACGTPCVTTDVGDAATIVGNTGWVIPPKNAKALAQAIGLALVEREDEIQWHDRQHAARNRIVTAFSLRAMVEHYQKTWCVSD